MRNSDRETHVRVQQGAWNANYYNCKDSVNTRGLGLGLGNVLSNVSFVLQNIYTLLRTSIFKY